MILGGGYRKIALFALALVTTVSGTGLILLAAGLAAYSLRKGPRFTLQMVATGGLAIGALLVSPLGSTYLARAKEVTIPSSSGYQRFIAPYTHMWSILSNESWTRVLVGQGAGFADRNAASIQALTRLPLTSPPIAKLLEEYGLVAGGLFLGFLVYVLLARVPDSTMAVTILVFFFLLSGSLLQTQTVFVCWFFTSLFAHHGRSHGVVALPYKTGVGIKRRLLLA